MVCEWKYQLGLQEVCNRHDQEAGENKYQMYWAIHLVYKNCRVKSQCAIIQETKERII